MGHGVRTAGNGKWSPGPLGGRLQGRLDAKNSWFSFTNVYVAVAGRQSAPTTQAR